MKHSRAGSKPLEFPSDINVSPEAHDLLSKLVCSANDRLGAITDIQGHPFFSGIEWNQLRNSDPPHIPVVKSATDTSNFDDDDDLEDDIEEESTLSLSSERISNKPFVRTLPFVGFSYAPGDFLRSPAKENDRLSGPSTVPREDRSSGQETRKLKRDIKRLESEASVAEANAAHARMSSERNAALVDELRQNVERLSHELAMSQTTIRRHRNSSVRSRPSSDLIITSEAMYYESPVTDEDHSDRIEALMRHVRIAKSERDAAVTSEELVRTDLINVRSEMGKLSSRVHELELSLRQREIELETSSDRLVEAEGFRESAERTIEQIQLDHNVAIGEASALRKELDTMRREHYVADAKARERADAEHIIGQEAKDLVKRLNEAIKKTQETSEELYTSRDKADNDRRDFEATIRELTATVADRDALCTQLRESVTAARMSRDNSRAETLESQLAQEKLRSEFEKFRVASFTVSDTAKEDAASLIESRSLVEALTREIEDLHDQLEKVSSTTNDLLKERTYMTKKLNEMTMETQENEVALMIDIKKLHSEKDHAEKQLDDTLWKINAIKKKNRQQLRILEKKLESEKNARLIIEESMAHIKEQLHEEMALQAHEIQLLRRGYADNDLDHKISTRNEPIMGLSEAVGSRVSTVLGGVRHAILDKATKLHSRAGHATFLDIEIDPLASEESIVIASNCTQTTTHDNDGATTVEKGRLSSNNFEGWVKVPSPKGIRTGWETRWAVLVNNVLTLYRRELQQPIIEATVDRSISVSPELRAREAESRDLLHATAREKPRIFQLDVPVVVRDDQNVSPPRLKTTADQHRRSIDTSVEVSATIDYTGGLVIVSTTSAEAHFFTPVPIANIRPLFIMASNAEERAHWVKVLSKSTLSKSTIYSH